MEEFDVVVVGGGAAGCVIAARLAEAPSRSVLLLEAGPDLRASPPDGFRDGWGLPQGFDWGFVSEPTATAHSEPLRRIKLLGGTSWLTRFAPRGSPADFDAWAAGTYGSPPILLRSGIGPPEHLASVGIPVRIDLPGVGANLIDHPGVDVDCGYRGEIQGEPILHLLASFHSATMAAGDPPDLVFWLADPTGGNGEPPWFGIDILLMKPESRGTVRLRSADPLEAPCIRLPRVSEPFDVERLAEGYRRALEVASRPELRRVCAARPVAETRAEEELHGWIRSSAFSCPHVVGTCAMGRRPDDGAVVDSSGRVHGTERLSIVDASIMPDAPSGFPHIPTVMIAELLAERIAPLV